jgi:hypothetical protein
MRWYLAGKRDTTGQGLYQVIVFARMALVLIKVSDIVDRTRIRSCRLGSHNRDNAEMVRIGVLRVRRVVRNLARHVVRACRDVLVNVRDAESV